VLDWWDSSGASSGSASACRDCVRAGGRENLSAAGARRAAHPVDWRFPPAVLSPAPFRPRLL